MSRELTVSEFDALLGCPRLGWVTQPSPVSQVTLPDSAGGARFWVKRDDQLDALYGSSKPRKLDYLLAAAPFAEAEAWSSVGAIGSGHLVALTAAAQQLDRKLHAHCFWEPLSAGVVDNLAYVASFSHALDYFSTRASLALRRPGLLLAETWRDTVTIAPGATTVTGMLGLVRAGLELGEQVRAHELEAPAHLYVPLGSGGTAVGLAVGLGLAGLRPTLHAVAAVERVFSTRLGLGRLQARLLRRLADHGLELTQDQAPAAIVIDHSQVGPGYGQSTAAALLACEQLTAAGVQLEPIYSGKAMAALLKHPEREGPVLFWFTAHGGTLPQGSNWRERLPPALARRLERKPLSTTRRRLLQAGAAALVLAAGADRLLLGYEPLPNWKGTVLSAREATILQAVAEALISPRPTGQALLAIAQGVDGFLSYLPDGLVREIHVLITFIEQSTPLGLELRRLSNLTPAARESALSSLRDRGGLLLVAYRGIRDLCLLGHYQQPSTWPALSYAGPLFVRDQPREPWPAYEQLRAVPGALPRGLVQ